VQAQRHLSLLAGMISAPWAFASASSFLPILIFELPGDNLNGLVRTCGDIYRFRSPHKLSAGAADDPLVRRALPAYVSSLTAL